MEHLLPLVSVLLIGIITLVVLDKFQKGYETVINSVTDSLKEVAILVKASTVTEYQQVVQTQNQQVDPQDHYVDLDTVSPEELLRSQHHE